ncbi:hypothetical protein M9H77_23823 [Catharanthus roseus]|uniref:Uncharacterized protein n=1 Tax=Catharanthus roseus TaxID=4058 RepID=A0ACC0AVW6_CATRO|nr:hypothetical protein M9H77_23823 [Catharanthus roseus]
MGTVHKPPKREERSKVKGPRLFSRVRVRPLLPLFFGGIQFLANCQLSTPISFHLGIIKPSLAPVNQTKEANPPLRRCQSTLSSPEACSIGKSGKKCTFSNSRVQRRIRGYNARIHLAIHQDCFAGRVKG